MLRAMRHPGALRLVVLLLVLGLVATVSPWLLRAGYWLVSGVVGAVL